MSKHPKKDLEAAIEKMAIGGNNDFANCFHNFLDLALSYFCNNCDERQMALRKRVEENEDFRNAYHDALEAYGDLAEDYHDPMGDMFMEKISHGQNGQFFTPESLTNLMTEISFISKSAKDGDTINDPTCGSGRTLLAALRKWRENGLEPKLYANDLSMTCAKMCLLNFLVNSVEGEVTCGDALKLDWENFTFFKIDKVRNLATGAVFSTYWQYTLADVEKVSEKRQEWFWWIAEHGWIKYRHLTETIDPTESAEYCEKTDSMVSIEGNKVDRYDEVEISKTNIDPLPTEIKMGEQLSLF